MVVIFPPPLSTGSGGVTDHGALTGLDDDDHGNYYNGARLSAWGYDRAQTDTLIGSAVLNRIIGGQGVNAVVALTDLEYQTLGIKDPTTLYVILE